MSKILALDFGLRRTGLALTDDAKMFAFGLETVNSNVLMKRIGELIKTDHVDELVLGLPKRMNNQDSHITQNVLLLKGAIEKTFPTLDVHLLDERFTSKMASQAMHTAGATNKQKKEKELVDKVSATIILQSYLQSR